jgi:RNA recognition motif-containing protein
MNSKVFVGNLSFGTTEQQLRELFAEAGEVTSVAIPADRATGRPRGFAFVEFASDEHATAAIQRFEGQELDGRRLRVNAAEAKPAGGPGFGGTRSFGSDRPGPRPPRSKGSRRNVRARKRSIW